MIWIQNLVAVKEVFWSDPYVLMGKYLVENFDMNMISDPYILMDFYS